MFRVKAELGACMEECLLYGLKIIGVTPKWREMSPLGTSSYCYKYWFTILFINVCLPTASQTNYEEYIMCHGILSTILQNHEEDHACMTLYVFWETLMHPQDHDG